MRSMRHSHEGTRRSPTASAASSSPTPSRREAPASCASRRSAASPATGSGRAVLVFARDGYRAEQRIVPCRDALDAEVLPDIDARALQALGRALLEDAAQVWTARRDRNDGPVAVRRSNPPPKQPARAVARQSAGLGQAPRRRAVSYDGSSLAHCSGERQAPRATRQRIGARS